MKIARVLEGELKQSLSRLFNVLDYVRGDE